MGSLVGNIMVSGIEGPAHTVWMFAFAGVVVGDIVTTWYFTRNTGIKEGNKSIKEKVNNNFDAWVVEKLLNFGAIYVGSKVVGRWTGLDFVEPMAATVSGIIGWVVTLINAMAIITVETNLLEPETFNS